MIDGFVNTPFFGAMGAEAHGFAKDAAASYLGWWDLAGVDVAISEQPFDWLGKAPKTAPTPANEERIASFPATLDAFTTWLMSADLAEAGPSRRRVPPQGDPQSTLMIVADFPDHADVDDGSLLSGELGDLFDKMLGAIGYDRGSAYLATLSPGRPVTASLSAEAIESLKPALLHHMALVAPERLWLMGDAASRAVLGITAAAARGKLHDVNLNGRTVKAIATAHPRLYATAKGMKAAAWAEMQRLTQGDQA